jgi:hypothetical protein
LEKIKKTSNERIAHKIKMLIINFFVNKNYCKSNVKGKEKYTCSKKTDNDVIGSHTSS